MMDWLLRKAAALQPSRDGGKARSADPSECAIWQEISRALDQSPRSSGEKVRGLHALEPNGSDRADANSQGVGS